MDPVIRQTIARIDIMKDGRSIGRGTGFLVADGFVLTALHVVADRFQDPPVPYPGEIALQFPDFATRAVIHEDFLDPKADWALLRCSDAPPIRPMPMGGSPHSGAEFETYGFPDANPRDGMVQVGTVENNHAELDGAHVFQLYSRQAAAGNGAPVKGLSGAPIIVRNAAVGLLRFALMQEQMTVAGTLYACPFEAVRKRCGDLLPDPLVLLGKRLGSYEIIREVGRGGMGTVYLAKRSDEQFKKRVALKILRAEFDTAEVLRRFRHERQILATLSHPNIATLLDGGSTPSGEPYFVMDYIDGTPLDQYCDAHNLSVRDRIGVFRQICSAVQYVHQNLIVHRDLKPSNILVTPDGIPQLLDFGIAKILKPDAMATIVDVTRPESRVMTPAYASPEQVRGEPITTASDIYSLGVILYESLTGRRPYRVKSNAPNELTRAICDDDPERPSTAISRTSEDTRPDTVTITVEEVSRKRGTQPEKLYKRLRGDLDNILLKAMRKEPQRRYTSVEQLSEDLQRHLKHLPVTAHEDSLGYRAGKFIRRYRAPVIAAAIAVVSLVAGLVITLVEAKIARDQRALAESRFQDVKKLATTFLFDVHDSIKDLAGSTQARSLIAKTGTEYLDRLAQESHGDVPLQQEVAEGFIKIGDVEGDPYSANLGNTEKAIDNYRKALEMASVLSARNPQDRKALRTLAEAQSRLAFILPIRGKATEALGFADKAVGTFQRLLQDNPQDTDLKLGLASAYEGRGDILGGNSTSLGRIPEAVASYRNALQSIPDLPPDNPLARQATRAKAVLLIKLADYDDNQNHALEQYKESLQIAEGLSSSDPSNRRARDLVSHILAGLGFVQQNLGDLKSAEDTYRRATQLDEAGLKEDPSNSRARAKVIVSAKNLGDLYFYGLHNMPESLRCYRRVADLLEQACKEDPGNLSARSQLGEDYTYVASAMLGVGEADGARAEAIRGLNITKELADRPNATPDQVYKYAWIAITIEPTDLKDPAAILPYAQRAVSMSGGKNARSLYALAQCYAELRDYVHAIETTEKALALFPSGVPPTANQTMIADALGRYQQALKKSGK